MLCLRTQPGSAYNDPKAHAAKFPSHPKGESPKAQLKFELKVVRLLHRCHSWRISSHTFYFPRVKVAVGIILVNQLCFNVELAFSVLSMVMGKSIVMVLVVRECMQVVLNNRLCLPAPLSTVLGDSHTLGLPAAASSLYLQHQYNCLAPDLPCD